MSSVALIWRILGIAWTNVLNLNSVLYALTIIGCYCLLRLCMGRAIPIIGSLLLLYSPFHLSYLPNLRDYSVAPFALWFFGF